MVQTVKEKRMALTAKKVYAILKRQISDMEAKLNSPVRYRGTVATADLLPLNPDIGDMYNIESKSVYGEAGMNVAWNGVVWDTMGAPIDMSLYLTKEEAEAVIQRLVTEYFEKNPVKPGATTEQAQQIEQNKTNIASLKEETSSLKEDISTKITKFYASSQGETHITDSDNGKIQDMMIYGKSEQNQYKGINLLPTDISYMEIIEVSIPKGTRIFWATDGTPALGGNFKFYNEDKTQETWFGIDTGKTAMTITINIDAKYMEFLVSKDQSVKMCLGIGDDPVYEPYTGGQPSPSPDYPQEIKSVVNPTVKVSSEDETESQTVTLPYALNAIPVSSGGNITIDGQQYIADYVDVEHGKVIRNILKWRLGDFKYGFNNTVWHMNIFELGIDGSKNGLSNMFKIQNNRYNGVTTSELYIAYDGKAAALNMRGMTDEEFKKWLREKNPEVYNVLTVAEEIPITPEEALAFKQLMTYYPVTNVSVNSEQLDGLTVFNYPVSMANGWNYVKQQLNDNRDYIYDMDLQSAEAYVNSEYAVALTELEV